MEASDDQFVKTTEEEFYRARHLENIRLRREYIAKDIEKRGLPAVLTDIVEDPSLYRFRSTIGEPSNG